MISDPTQQAPRAAPDQGLEDLRDKITYEYALQTTAEVLALLNERQADYVVVGGVALQQYLPERRTKDLDMIMPISEVKRFPEIRFVRRFVHFAHGFYHEMPVDALLTSSPIFETVRCHHQVVASFRGLPMRCVSVEGMYLLKVYALSSTHQKSLWHKLDQAEADLLGLLLHYPMRLEPFADQLAAYLPTHEVTYLRETLLPDLYQQRDGAPRSILVPVGAS